MEERLDFFRVGHMSVRYGRLGGLFALLFKLFYRVRKAFDSVFVINKEIMRDA